MPRHPYLLPQDLLPQALLDEARIGEVELKKFVRYVEASRVQPRDADLVFFEDANNRHFALTTTDLIEFLSVSRRREASVLEGEQSEYSTLTSRGGKNILRFIDVYFGELRKIICTGKKTLGSTMHAALVAIAGWLSSQFGVEQPRCNGCCCSDLDRPCDHKGCVLQDD